MFKKTALVLEGGGFRGIFTAGVLEVFLENGLFFESVYGVSAGATYSVSYVSKQPGRNIAVNEMIGDKRYCSVGNLLRNGSLFSWDFIFEEIPQKIIPFDYDALKGSPTKVYIGTSDCHTGETEFFLLNTANKSDFKTLLAASCSLPLIAPMVSYGGKTFMDGGLSDSIPFEYALNDGNERAVVVLTQPKGYVKGPLKSPGLFKWYYRKHPKVYEMLLHRAERYNAAILRLEELERAGKVFVIRPKEKLDISRLENKPHKTALVYESAMLQTQEEIAALQTWLNS